MKTLLRTIVIGLLVCAGYAAVATDTNVPHNGAAMPAPICTPGSNSAVAATCPGGFRF